MSAIDFLTIKDQETRRKKFEWLTQNAEGHQELLVNTCMELERIRLKIFKNILKFSQYFTTNLREFYDDPEVETRKK